MSEMENGKCVAKSLQSFVFKEVLGGDPTRKSIFLLLEKAEDGTKAVLLCNKQAFEEDGGAIEKWLASAQLTTLTANDRYSNNEMLIEPMLNLLKVTMIHPAREFDVEKYRRQDAFLLHETADDYKNITLPYIQATVHKENLQWVYNFLDKKSEADRIVHENDSKYNGFLLAPDLKWNGTNLDELYLLAVAHRRDLRSVRDLTPNELPLLENIRDECAKVILEKYGLQNKELKMYFHYQPTFYHLHVHIVHVKYEAPGLGCTSILLDEAIENLKLLPDYYAKATLPFFRKQNDPLYKKFEEAGRA